jgi:hypothetical protein
VKTSSLAAVAEKYLVSRFSAITMPLFFRTNLTFEEQTNVRGKPRPYLDVATALVRDCGLRTVVEIGGMRQPMTHALSEFDPVCCNDGHSTLFWAATGAEVFSIDIDPQSALILSTYGAKYPNLHVQTRDGIAFLNELDAEIDLLYLDAWDVVAGTDYAEKHREAYFAARDNLAESALILIDDTDIMFGGKGRLAIPHMITDGFSVLTGGRQTMLVR